MASPYGFDTALVEQAQAGNEAAREQIFVTLQPILRAFFIKRIGFKTEVDDLVQNTMLRVHGGLTDLKDSSRLKAFAMKAALFELQDLYRGRYGPKESLYDPEIPPERSEMSNAAGIEVDVERALSSLTPKARQILELREYGYRYQEIAEMIETTEAAVKMQVKRAFERMRSVLSVAGVMLVVFGLCW